MTDTLSKGWRPYHSVSCVMEENKDTGTKSSCHGSYSERLDSKELKRDATPQEVLNISDSDDLNSDGTSEYEGYQIIEDKTEPETKKLKLACDHECPKEMHKVYIDVCDIVLGKVDLNRLSNDEKYKYLKEHNRNE